MVSEEAGRGDGEAAAPGVAAETTLSGVPENRLDGAGRGAAGPTGNSREGADALLPQGRGRGGGGWKAAWPAPAVWEGVSGMGQVWSHGQQPCLADEARVAQ